MNILKKKIYTNLTRSQILLGSTCSAFLVDDVGAGEHDLEGNDDKDEHTHLGSRGGDH